MGGPVFQVTGKPGHIDRMFVDFLDQVMYWLWIVNNELGNGFVLTFVNNDMVCAQFV